MGRLIVLLAIAFVTCSETTKKVEPVAEVQDSVAIKKVVVDSLDSPDVIAVVENEELVADTTMVDVADYKDSILLSFPYADTANFLHEKVYDCSACFLRKEAADALVKVQDSLNKIGLQVVIFDCFRPFSVQQRMWEILPDARYVANPNRRGSSHNYGLAVDLTLADMLGDTIPMGTAFDYFGKEHIILLLTGLRMKLWRIGSFCAR